MQEPGFWDDADKAGKITKELNYLKSEKERFEHIEELFSDAETLIEMG